MYNGFRQLSFSQAGPAAGAPAFRADGRFSHGGRQPAHSHAHEPAPADPIENAYADGYAAALADAQAHAEEQARLAEDARDKLDLSFVRLDRDLEEELRLRLRETVAALCESAIAPMALDEDMLTRRIRTAVSMLARADDERVIRLHPDDIALVSPRFEADWIVVPDPALERGALRVEGANGGIEDGLATWRRAIAEALHQC
ncbi:MAG TPA: FliH/SctL family protein [Novosphingobium sp.]|nr:FliH/SctL family protein [Novosphingobium sp.]